MDTKMIYLYIIDKTIRETKKDKEMEKRILQKRSIVSVLKWKRGSILELWGLPEVGRRHY
mgnify:CR=1 FL=1